MSTLAKEGAGDGVPQVPTMPEQRSMDAAIATIEPWIRRNVAEMEDVRLIEASVPKGTGVANETILLRGQSESGGSRHEVGFVVRVDCKDHIFMDVDPFVHYQMYRALYDAPGVPVPRMLGFEGDRGILGERFYVMERLEGRAAPDNPHFTTGGWVLDLPVESRERMWRGMVTVLSHLHAQDRSLFPFLEKPDLGESGLEQSLNFWFRYARWSGADEFDSVRQAMAWLKDTMPKDCRTCATWGGGGPQNFLFHGDGSVAAILDWDMASLAGAENDLAIWFVMDAHRILPGFGTPAQTVALWEELSGRRLENMEWHLVFASFMLDVITIRLPRLLRKQGFLDESGYDLYMAKAGCRAASQIGLKWNGPPLAPPIRLES